MSDLLGQIDVAFVIDSTGSMEPWIKEARSKALAEAEKLATSDDLDFRYAVVAYRDHPPQDHSFVTQVHPFTADKGTFQAYLSGLAPNGGGDAAEAVWDGLVDAGNLDWRPNADRIVFLLGDASPHGGYTGSDHWPDGCPCGLEVGGIAELYSFNHIRLYAISLAADPDTTRAFTEVAEVCGGNCVEAERPAKMSESYATTMSATTDTIKMAREVTMSVSVLGSDASDDTIAAHLSTTTGMHVNSAHVAGTKAYMSSRGIDPTTGTTTSWGARSGDAATPAKRGSWAMNTATGKYEKTA